MTGVDCRSQQTATFQYSAMSGDEAVSIKVFQDLTLTSCDGQRSALRDALHRNAAPLGTMPGKGNGSFRIHRGSSSHSNAQPETILPHPGLRSLGGRVDMRS